MHKYIIFGKSQITTKIRFTAKKKEHSLHMGKVNKENWLYVYKVFEAETQIKQKKWLALYDINHTRFDKFAITVCVIRVRCSQTRFEPPTLYR